MSLQSWQETIYTMIGNGPTLTAAAEALMVPDFSIPASYMYPGRVLRATLFGKASNAVTTPGTVTLRCRWGGLAGTVLAASAALTQNVAVQTDKSWWLTFYIQCLTVGSTGTFITFGTAHRGNQAAAAVADMTPDLIPANTPAAVTVDTTTAKLLSFTAQPSLATASWTCMQYVLEAMN